MSTTLITGATSFLGYHVAKKLNQSGIRPRVLERPGQIEMAVRIRFATRVMVTSAEELLAVCGATVDDIDLYVPHQANKRIVDHAVKNLGLDPQKVLMNIDRYGNTSSASIPICLAEARDKGLLEEGTRVLVSAVGAGLTWGSAYMTWTSRN